MNTDHKLCEPITVVTVEKNNCQAAYPATIKKILEKIV